MTGKSRESGQALVAATFGLVALIAATGLAVDIGYLRYQKRLQQSAADSAAIAGAAEQNPANIPNAARQDSALNGFTDGVNNVTVTVNQPPKTGPNTGAGGYVETIISAQQPTFFMKIFGLNSTTLAARAVATYGGNGPRNCMYALPGGTGVTVANGANVNVQNCGIIDDQSFSNRGTVNAASIGARSISRAGSATPAPVGGIVPAADPLSFLQQQNPPLGTCFGPNVGVVNGNGNASLNPGRYCVNGISISGNVNVTFQPGIYVVSGGGITFNGNGNVTGTGVTFYLTNAGANDVTLHQSQKVNLTAPTNGTYAGILFYQNVANNAAATIDGSNNSKFQGGFYFPGAALNINGGATRAAYMIFVAKSLNLNDNVRFSSNYGSLANGSPIKNAVLVE